MAILAIRITARPPDKGHPYGNHKAEYLPAVIVGALIMVAALAILPEAYLGFLKPSPSTRPGPGWRSAPRPPLSTCSGARC